MGAPHPDGAGDAWDGNGDEGGQSEVDGGDGGRSEPELDGGAALRPSLPLLSLLCLLSRPLLSLRSDRPCLRQAGAAEG